MIERKALFCSLMIIMWIAEAGGVLPRQKKGKFKQRAC